MIKAKQYDWLDSNVALFSSDTDRQVKKESALTEPAWKGTEATTGVHVWRIEKFKVVSWPKESYGSFYNGDSYIVLNCYKEEDELKFDAHFWIGEHSTQDEYGTAAYKTVELDTYLNDKAIQHRETQSFESSKFKSYFPQMMIMEGGSDSGFNHVEPEKYKPRLFHVIGEKTRVQVHEVPYFRESINSCDVFIIDNGLSLYQFNGATSSPFEKNEGSKVINKIKSDRSGRPKVVVIDERDAGTRHEAIASLPTGGQPIQTSLQRAAAKVESFLKLYRLSDSSGALKFELVAQDKLSMDLLDPSDVFIVDCCSKIFVWIGSGASPEEKKNGLCYAHKHLSKGHPHPMASVSVLKQGQEDNEFKALFK